MSPRSDLHGSYAGVPVLVTGGAGAIGSRLVAALCEASAQTIVLDDLSSAHLWNLPDSKNLLFVEGSVTDEIALKRVFNERPAVVFHLAAFFANQNSVDFPERDLTVNGMGTLKILEYSALTGVDRVVYASSSSIYGEDPPLPVVETVSSTRLTTPYQITKKLGEYYCDFFNRHHGLPTVRARFFNSYGPGEVPGQYRNVIPNFIYRAIRGAPLVITGTGHETRDFTFVSDVVDGLLACGMNDGAVGEAFNLAGGRETRIVDLATEIIRLTGSSSPIEHIESRKWDTKKRFLASNEKARAVLGFAPTVTLDQGLQETIDWFKHNWERIEPAASTHRGQSAAHRG